MNSDFWRHCWFAHYWAKRKCCWCRREYLVNFGDFFSSSIFLHWKLPRSSNLCFFTWSRTNLSESEGKTLLPSVAAHLGEAEWKFTLAKLFNRLNKQAQFSLKYLCIIGFEIWYMLYAFLKTLLNIVWSGLEQKDLTITAVGTVLHLFVSLAVMCKFCRT